MLLIDKILIATSNKNKFIEFQDIIKSAFEREKNPAGEKIFADGIIFAPDFANSITIKETGSNYIENAVLKAEAWCKISGLPSLADDSGFEVEALNNAPGIFSNRIISGTDDIKIKWVLDKLKAVNNERQNFYIRRLLQRPCKKFSFRF